MTEDIFNCILSTGSIVGSDLSWMILTFLFTIYK